MAIKPTRQPFEPQRDSHQGGQVAVTGAFEWMMPDVSYPFQEITGAPGKKEM